MNQPGMYGKICLVTGANAGIGKATSQQDSPAWVPPSSWSAATDERGESARAEISAKTGSPNLDLLIADLSSQGSIRKLARTFTSQYPQLHVLINNAGAITPRRRLTVDGIETQFAVNHLAPFLLTNLLLDTLKESAPSRIVTVSSQVHSKSPLDLDDLRSDREYTASQVYRKTKLANILFTYELARRLEGQASPPTASTPASSRPSSSTTTWAAPMKRASAPARASATAPKTAPPSSSTSPRPPKSTASQANTSQGYDKNAVSPTPRPHQRDGPIETQSPTTKKSSPSRIAGCGAQQEPPRPRRPPLLTGDYTLVVARPPRHPFS